PYVPASTASSSTLPATNPTRILSTRRLIRNPALSSHSHAYNHSDAPRTNSPQFICSLFPHPKPVMLSDGSRFCEPKPKHLPKCEGPSYCAHHALDGIRTHALEPHRQRPEHSRSRSTKNSFAKLRSLRALCVKVFPAPSHYPRMERWQTSFTSVSGTPTFASNPCLRR